MSQNCIRCYEPVASHKGGQCPDGQGSFTWGMPSREDLKKAAARIATLAKERGDGGLEASATALLAALEKKGDN